MRQKTCHYVAAFTFTTYLTRLEIFRWHSSFNISFFPLVGLLSTKNKRDKNRQTKFESQKTDERTYESGFNFYKKCKSRRTMFFSLAILTSSLPRNVGTRAK